MVKLRGRKAYPFYFGTSPTILRIAAGLRQNMTKAEKLLWKEIRNRKCNGLKFRRQHPIADFVVDFFCYEAMQVIELDGEIHDDGYQKERDHARTIILNELGIKVIRFNNKDVFNHNENVIAKIKTQLSANKVNGW